MASEENYNLPNALRNLSSASPTNSRNHKTWISHLNRRKGDAQPKRIYSQRLKLSNIVPKWWRIKYFRGMINDIKRRAPYYWSDWRDAWDYRVVPATVYMYFAKYVTTPRNMMNCAVEEYKNPVLTIPSILPALAFSLDMFAKTNSSFGVNEVLLSSVLAAVVFSLFAAQPLTIVGVTGPITVFNYTVYDIMASRTNYFAFMCWIGM